MCYDYTKKGGFLQQLRLYFPSFQATQLVCGVATTYSKEIKKLRKFGIEYVTPHLRRSKLLEYPFKITIIFYSISDQDAVSTLTTAAFLLHLFESNGVIQSTDYRVVPDTEIIMKKVKKLEEEGCEIILDQYQGTK